MYQKDAISSLILLSLVSACSPFGLPRQKTYPHVAFVVPSPTAPYDDRLAAYQALRPEVQKKGLIFKTDVPKKRKKANDPLQLMDGTKVHHSEDLAPLVLPDSITAQAIERHLMFEKQQKIWASSAIGLTALASSGLSLGTFVFVRGDDDRTENIGLGLALGSIVLGAVSVAVSVPITRGKLELAQKANEEAFVNYDPSLKSFLGICQKDERLVDCYATEGNGTQPPKESLLERLKKKVKR
jgi:hypothetical protein